VLWSFGYNVGVALVALFLGIGVALVFISARHILLGIPAAFEKWRSLVTGPDLAARFPSTQAQPWPNRNWIIEAFLYSGVTIVVLLWFNIKLIDPLLKIIP
jgi:hypothetical protein